MTLADEGFEQPQANVNLSRKGKRWQTWESRLLCDCTHHNEIIAVAAKIGRPLSSSISRRSIMRKKYGWEVAWLRRYASISTEDYVAQVRVVARETEIPARLILSHRRMQPVSIARWRVWKHFRDLGFSLPAIGDVSGFDHCSVLNGLRRLSTGIVPKRLKKHYRDPKTRRIPAFLPSKVVRNAYAGRPIVGKLETNEPPQLLSAEAHSET